MEALNKYEKTRLLGARALQISLGAPVLLKKLKKGVRSPVEIAELELSEDVIPIVVKRS